MREGVRWSIKVCDFCIFNEFYSNFCILSSYVVISFRLFVVLLQIRDTAVFMGLVKTASGLPSASLSLQGQPQDPPSSPTEMNSNSRQSSASDLSSSDLPTSKPVDSEQRLAASDSSD